MSIHTIFTLPIEVVREEICIRLSGREKASLRETCRFFSERVFGPDCSPELWMSTINYDALCDKYRERYTVNIPKCVIIRECDKGNPGYDTISKMESSNQWDITIHDGVEVIIIDRVTNKPRTTRKKSRGVNVSNKVKPVVVNNIGNLLKGAYSKLRLVLIRLRYTDGIYDTRSETKVISDLYKGWQTENLRFSVLFDSHSESSKYNANLGVKVSRYIEGGTFSSLKYINSTIRPYHPADYSIGLNLINAHSFLESYGDIVMRNDHVNFGSIQDKHNVRITLDPKYVVINLLKHFNGQQEDPSFSFNVLKSLHERFLSVEDYLSTGYGDSVGVDGDHTVWCRILLCCCFYTSYKMFKDYLMQFDIGLPTVNVCRYPVCDNRAKEILGASNP